VATQKRGASLDWVALPVSGECELITADLTPAGESGLGRMWLRGFSHDGEVIEVLNLDALTPAPVDRATPRARRKGPEATRMMVPGKPAKILLIDSKRAVFRRGWETRCAGRDLK